MKNSKWMQKNTASLAGKTVVITGATGGLGSAACRYILALSGRILMINRNREKSEALCAALRAEFPNAEISYRICDLENISEVRETADELSQVPVDILVLNAGTFAIPRALCSTGCDSVFQTNFLSHYILVRRLLPLLSARKARVTAVGSIAHDFVRLDPKDPDYARHDGDQKIYGNSKRFLMYALMELLKQYPDISFGIGHPGICFTGITSHYPKRQLAFIRPSMKLLFMWPNMAVRSIVKAMFAEVPYLHWVGPRFFDIWGNPRIKALNTCSQEERQAIFRTAETLCDQILQTDEV